MTRVLLAVVALTLLSAHVAPSVDDNNRYLKVTPLGDRIRLAYTVFFGEIPGANERRGLDANRDGTIDDAEAKAFGQRLGAEVASALVVEIDGTVVPVTWQAVDVGLGTPEVAAGAFSVDLVAYPCLPSLRGHHRIVVKDHFHVPHPGETEVKVEDSPDVAVERAHVGPANDPAMDYRFVGPGGPIEDDGLELVFTAGPKSPVTTDAVCTGRARGASGSGWWRWVVGLGLGLGLGVGIVLRRRRATAPSP